MEFSHYDDVPNEIAEKVIAAHKPHHGGDEAGEENGKSASAPDRRSSSSVWLVLAPMGAKTGGSVLVFRPWAREPDRC